MYNQISTTKFDYQILKQIGAGGQGTVFLALNKQTNEKVAIKATLLLYESSKVEFQEEKRTIQYLMDNQVSICKVKEMEVVGNLGITVMKYYNMDLYSYVFERDTDMKENREYFVKKIFVKICKILLKLHQVGVAHLDIKPENFLVDTKSGEIAICDFGAAKIVGNVPMVSSDCGTKEYLSPEKIAFYVCDAYKADSFALGVTLFVFLNQYFPANEYGIPCYDSKKLDLTPSCKDILSQLLSTDPHERLSIIKVMNHPWIRKPSNIHSFKKLVAFTSIIKTTTKKFDFPSSNCRNYSSAPRLNLCIHT